MSRLEREAREDLARLDAQGLMRRILPAQGIDFCSNDYLGLRRDPRVIAAARTVLVESGLGSGAARLLGGDHAVHRELERRFATLQRAEDALLFPTGFMANLGVIEALVPEGWTVVSDASNHASIVEGCRAARGRTVIVPHNDLDAYRHAVGNDRTLVVTESVFSMSGDRAPVEALVELCRQRGAALLVDEAHALGLFPAAEGATLRVNPCGKALGGAGAVVTGPRSVIDLLRSRCRSFLFTTAQPPAVSAGVLAALEIAGDERWRAERALGLARRVRPDATSCIVPLACRDNVHALEAQAHLQERDLDVRAVRPPAVPQAVLRLSLHADRTDAEIDRLLEGLAEVGVR